MTPSGGVLGVGGTSRDSSLATLALLPDADPASSFDASTQAAAHCDQCAARKPRRVFAFEDVELSRLFTHRHPFVNNLVVSGTDLKASINLRLTPGGGQMIALIGPDQRIKSLSFADSYWRAHDELHQSGDIDHGAAECPERGVPLVARAWTSAGGWHDVTANPEPASQ